MRAAVIGIGSNSLRMLLADIADGRMTRLKRYREGLRTFAALDGEGRIAPQMIALAREKVCAFSREARAAGAETVCLFATSAVRDAKNQQEFIAALESATRLPLEVCSGEWEAKLSFVGATDGQPSGLIDIGGGSTEIAVGSGTRVEHAVSLQMGAVRLFRMQPITDARTAAMVEKIAADILRPALPAFLNKSYPQWIGVGGTFTTAAALAQDVPWDDRKRIHDYLLHVEALEGVVQRLAPMPMEERLRLPSLQPQRADIVVHGMAVLLACMRCLRISAIRVSEYGNLEGYLKMKYIYASGGLDPFAK